MWSAATNGYNNSRNEVCERCSLLIGCESESGTGMAHKYAVGDGVGYHNSRSLESIFKVMRLLPTEDHAGEPRYKIKADGETFERVVAESELELVFRKSEPVNVFKK
jgi:hypothetical protein